MITNDILRLAGVPASLQIKKPVENQPCCDDASDAKYLIINAIEKYSNDYDKSTGMNTKNVYRDIINRLDDIVGCLTSNQQKCAIEKFNKLDNKIKTDIAYLDSQGVCNTFFKCNEKQVEEPSEPAESEKQAEPSEQTPHVVVTTAKPMVNVVTKPSDKKEEDEDEKEDEKDEDEDKEEKPKKKKVSETYEGFEGFEGFGDLDDYDLISLFEAEKELPPEREFIEKVKVPTEVISDLKFKIKELDDGNNYQYTKHLKNAADDELHYCNKRRTLETILDYLTNANDVSINNCTTYVSTLDSTLRKYIPCSVWKFLTVPSFVGNSLKDRMKQIKIK